MSTPNQIGRDACALDSKCTKDEQRITKTINGSERAARVWRLRALLALTL